MARSDGFLYYAFTVHSTGTGTGNGTGAYLVTYPFSQSYFSLLQSRSRSRAVCMTTIPWFILMLWSMALWRKKNLQIIPFSSCNRALIETKLETKCFKWPDYVCHFLTCQERKLACAGIQRFNGNFKPQLLPGESCTGTFFSSDWPRDKGKERTIFDWALWWLLYFLGLPKYIYIVL